MKKFIASIVTAFALLIGMPMVAAHAASWHTFWSGEDFGNRAHVCSPSVTSSHPWKLFVEYTPIYTSGQADMARFNDDNGTYAAWRRGEGSWSLSKSNLPAGTHEHACVTSLPDSDNDGWVDVYAKAYY